MGGMRAADTGAGRRDVSVQCSASPGVGAHALEGGGGGGARAAENDTVRGQKRNRSKKMPFGMRQTAAKRRAHWAELLDDGGAGP